MLLLLAIILSEIATLTKRIFNFNSNDEKIRKRDFMLLAQD